MKIFRLMVFLFFSFQIMTLHTVLAAPPLDDLEAFLTEIGMSRSELVVYLAYYETTLDDFNSIDKLREMTGTKITNENLMNLLTEYEMTIEDLNSLLAEFGETVADYVFIEDLDSSVDFYLNHDEELEGLDDMLATIGLDENEIDRLFTHFTSLNLLELEEKMEKIKQRVEPFLEIDETTELTKRQAKELVSIMHDLYAILQLEPKVYLETNGKRTSISFDELIQMKDIPTGHFVIDMYNLERELLANYFITPEIMSPTYMIGTTENLIGVADIAGEKIKEMHKDKMPITASSFLTNSLIGLILIFGGILLFIRGRKQNEYKQ